MVLQRNRNQSLTEKENTRILFLCGRFRKTDLGIELHDRKCFSRVDTKHKIISIISSFSFCSYHLSFRKSEGGLFLLTFQAEFKLFIIFIQRMVSLMIILFSTKCFLSVYMYIDLINLKPINYLKIVVLTSLF